MQRESEENVFPVERLREQDEIGSLGLLLSKVKELETLYHSIAWNSRTCTLTSLKIRRKKVRRLRSLLVDLRKVQSRQKITGSSRQRGRTRKTGGTEETPSTHADHRTAT